LDRAEALDTALGQIERQFGKGSVMKMSDRAQVSVGAISTGSLALDLALGIGGLPRGRIVEIFGPESSGKTTLVYHVIAEAENGDVRQPWTLFAPVDAGRLERLVQTSGERRRLPAVVVEREHADAPRLAIPTRAKANDRGRESGRAQSRDHGIQVADRSMAEERKGDVEVLRRDDPPPAELGELPRHEALDDRGREPQAAEESQTFIARHASGRNCNVRHNSVTSLRTRCSAVTLARRRTVSRSPGNEESAARSRAPPPLACT